MSTPAPAVPSPAYPAADANLVVVYGWWFDHTTRRGVNQPITATPQLADGQRGAGGTPNLRDSGGGADGQRADIKLRTWTTRPLDSGMWAFPLLPTVDQETGTFGGWTIQPGTGDGAEQPITIGVPEDTETGTVTQDIADAVAYACSATKGATVLHLPVGSQVQLLHIADAPQPPPAWIAPASHYDAPQTRALVTQRLAEHDDSENAHPFLKALIDLALGLDTGDGTGASGIKRIATTADAGDLETGTVPDARLGSGIARVAAVQTLVDQAVSYVLDTVLNGVTDVELDTVKELAAWARQDRSGITAAAAAAAAAIAKAIGTAKGDSIGYSAAGTPIRVPIGATPGYVKTVDPTAAAGWSWQAPPAGGGGGGGSYTDTQAKAAARADLLAALVTGIAFGTDQATGKLTAVVTGTSQVNAYTNVTGTRQIDPAFARTLIDAVAAMTLDVPATATDGTECRVTVRNTTASAIPLSLGANIGFNDSGVSFSGGFSLGAKRAAKLALEYVAATGMTGWRLWGVSVDA